MKTIGIRSGSPHLFEALLVTTTAVVVIVAVVWGRIRRHHLEYSAMRGEQQSSSFASIR